MPNPIKGPDGKEYKSLVELAKAYDTSYTTLKYRLDRGMPLEDALSGRTMTTVIGPDGREYPSFEAMCRAHNLKASTVQKRLRQGEDLETALRPAQAPKKAYDHLGNEYETFAEMCRRYGKPESTVKYRLDSGLDLETALTGKSVRDDVNNGNIEDHLGNKFRTFAEMCEYHKKPPASVRDRLKKGMDLKSALEKPSLRRKFKDHLNNEFSSLTAMCNHYGKNLQTVEARLKRGSSIEQALTSDDTSRTCYDHENRKFPSFNAMCRAHDIDPRTVHGRLSANWPLEKALTVPSGESASCEDHLGNIYKSFESMCKAYGMSSVSVKGRLKRGYTLEDALAKKDNMYSKLIENDPLGHVFPSFKAMQNYYMLGPHQLYQHKNPSVKNICDSLKGHETTIDERRVKITDAMAPYLKIEMDDVEYILHLEKLLDIYHKSNEFDPRIGFTYLKPRISNMAPAGFPYYDIVIDGVSKRISYWDLVREEITCLETVRVKRQA